MKHNESADPRDITILSSNTVVFERMLWRSRSSREGACAAALWIFSMARREIDYICVFSQHTGHVCQLMQYSASIWPSMIPASDGVFFVNWGRLLGRP